MDRKILGIEILSGQILSTNPIMILIFTPLFFKYLNPKLNNYIKLNSVNKIIIGFFLTFLSFVLITIIQYWIDLGKEVINDKSKSDYIVKPVLIRKSGYAKSAKGYIAFLKTDSGEEVLRSQIDKGMRNAFQGMKNPFVLCFDRIITKQFPKLLPLLN